MQINTLECDRCKRRVPGTGDHTQAWTRVVIKTRGHGPATEYDLCPACVALFTSAFMVKRGLPGTGKRHKENNV